MSTWTFKNLPANYQKGCLKIQAWCQELLEEAQISVTSIDWEDLNLNKCKLVISMPNKRFAALVKRGWWKWIIHTCKIPLNIN